MRGSFTDGISDLMWDFAADQYMDPAGVLEKFGVNCEQIADFLALAGDAVDNIPGAPGIGAKTAARLLAYFGSLEQLLAGIEQVPASRVRGAARIQATLTEHASQVRLYRKITGIKCDVPLDVTIDDVKVRKPDDQAIMEFCEAMGFEGHLQSRMLRIARK